MDPSQFDAPDDDDADDDSGRASRIVRRRGRARVGWSEDQPRGLRRLADLIEILLELPIAGKVAISSHAALLASMAWLGWNASIHAPWSAINVVLAEIAFDESGVSLPWTALFVAACIAGTFFRMEVSELIPVGVFSWGIVACLCGWLARAVAVEPRKWAATLLGVTLGPVGVIVAALMPPDHTRRN
jgi:hypothetical protein